MSNFKSFRKAFGTRAFRNGGYSILITTAVVIVAILLNALISSLPSSIVKPSISPYDYYSLTDVTKELVGGIDEDVTLYYIVTAGGEDEVWVEFARRYCELNGKLSLRFVDPTASPAFVDKYSELAGGNLTENSIVVLNEASEEARLVVYEEVFGRTFASQEEYMYYMMGYDVGTKYFAGENKLTAALEYVTMEIHPVIHYTAGHGETAIGTNLSGALDDDNFLVQELNLLTGENTLEPRHSIVLINAPTRDFAQSEIDTLREYMKQGGKVLLFTDYQNGDLPLLFGLMGEYGMAFKEGMVIEGNVNNYMRAPYILKPNVTASVITEKLESTNLNFFLPLSHAIGTVEGLDSNEYTMTVLMNTSNAAYIRIFDEDAQMDDSTLAKQEGDEVGIFSLAVMTKNSADGAAVWFSTAFFADDQFLGYNAEYLFALLTHLTGKQGSITIATKTLTDTSLIVSQGAQGLWAVVLMGVVPLGCVGVGLYIWNKRRKQ